MEMQTESLELHHARLYWINGQRIPTDLAMALAAQGYDVQSLEDIYLS